MSEVTGVFSRTLQRRLLVRMRDRYPDAVYDFEENNDDGRMLANLMYLDDHGLCRVVVNRTHYGVPSHSNSTITAKGIDFMEDDGGLSAVLGVVTIKFHADTIRELLSNKIEESPIPAEEKSRLKKALSGITEAGLKTVTTDLIQKGIEAAPDFIHWVQRIL
jgi:hypothetical protein